MRRTIESEAMNRIANFPETRPWLGGTHPLDLTSTLADLNNFAFITDDEQGGYIYHKTGAGLYSVHTISVPTKSVRQMFDARSASLREMFTKSDAVQIDTMIPDGNRAAGVWAAHAGFREVFKRQKAFNLMGEMVDVTYCSLSYLDWAIRDKGCKYDGSMFKAAVHDETEDLLHDAMIGATLECCLQGNADKGISLFNRYAAHAGHVPIRVVTVHPLVLDISTHVLQYTNDGMQVLHVRSPEGLPNSDDLGSPECPSPPSPVLPAM